MAKKNEVSLTRQRQALKACFPDADPGLPNDGGLTFSYWAKPSPLSPRYRLLITCARQQTPKVYVLDPKPLSLFPGELRLPHVYSTREQRLCLYHPSLREWDASMFIVRTIVPWASEWLFHYEIWLATGKWSGGGVEHAPASEKAKAA